MLQVIKIDFEFSALVQLLQIFSSQLLVLINSFLDSVNLILLVLQVGGGEPPVLIRLHLREVETGSMVSRAVSVLDYVLV